MPSFIVPVPPPAPAPVPGQDVISPLVSTYAAQTPYITRAEFLNSPTALEVIDLIPGGDSDAQNQAIDDAISRASSWIDDLCEQVLAATLDMDRGRYRVNRYGLVIVPLRYKPILEIRAINVGSRPSQMSTLADTSDVAIMGRGTVEIPVLGTLEGALPMRGSFGIGDRPLVDVTYVNGWPNTITTAATTTSPATQALPLLSALGIYPGTPLTVYDGERTEKVAVNASYLPGTLPVPLTTPLQFAHDTGISVSNLPPRVKEAAVLLTVALIQTRGDDAIVLDTTDSPTKTTSTSGVDSANVKLAKDMLHGMGRVA